MGKLKKCPWCGNEAELVLKNMDDGNVLVYARCTNQDCLATAPPRRHSDAYGSIELAEEKAIKAWNNRDVKK